MLLTCTGTLKYYVNGNQVATTFSPGQNSFHPNLNIFRIGSYAGTFMVNGMASLEFYLRPLSQPEIIDAMTRSKTFPINPACNAN